MLSLKQHFLGKNRRGSDDEGGETADDLKKQMTNQEWETIYKMAKVCIENINSLKGIFYKIRWVTVSLDYFFCMKNGYSLSLKTRPVMH